LIAKERQNMILSRLQVNGTVSVTELAELQQVSIETVRRDLLLLEQQGLLQRVYGGAVKSVEMKAYPDLPHRKEDNREAKLELAETAASLVQEHDVLYIDAGSTAVFFAQALQRRFSQLTVITYSMDVFEILRQKEYTGESPPGYGCHMARAPYPRNTKSRHSAGASGLRTTPSDRRFRNQKSQF